MRRLAGAWLFLLLVLVFKHGSLLGPLPPLPPGASQSVPQGTPDGIPSAAAPAWPRVASGVPARFVSDPLFYFTTAPRDSLILLPGIGPVLADRIINARGGKRLYKTWDDLLTVKGIGTKKVEEFKRLAGKN